MLVQFWSTNEMILLMATDRKTTNFTGYYTITTAFGITDRVPPKTQNNKGYDIQAIGKHTHKIINPKS